MITRSKGNSNAQSLFGVHQIPSDNQIRGPLDPVAPEHVFPVFEEISQVLEQQGQLEGFRSVTAPLIACHRWHQVLQVEPNPLLERFNADDKVGGDSLLP